MDVCRDVLFDPLTRQQSLLYPKMYDIATNPEEVYPHSGLRAWEVKWFFIHEYISPSDRDNRYLVVQIRTNLLIVNWTEGKVAAVGEDYCLKWYYVRVDGF